MKIRFILFSILITFLSLAMPVGRMFAACESFAITSGGKPVSDVFAIPKDTDFNITFNLSDSKPAVYQTNGWFNAKFSPFMAEKGPTTPTNGVISFSISGSKVTAGKTYAVTLWYDAPGQHEKELCTKQFAISETESGTCSITISPSFPSVQDSITATVDIKQDGSYILGYDPTGGRVRSRVQVLTKGSNPPVTITNYGIGNARLFVANNLIASHLCELNFQVTQNGGASLESQFTDLCSFAEGAARTQCNQCIQKNPPEIWTAIGCIPATLDGFVQKVLPFGMALGGGIAFLLMLFGALQIMTSAGNPEKLNAGKELVTSAIVGLLLIIFSVFLLRLIGADILGIPGFK